MIHHFLLLPHRRVTVEGELRNLCYRHHQREETGVYHHHRLMATKVGTTIAPLLFHNGDWKGSVHAWLNFLPKQRLAKVEYTND